MKPLKRDDEAPIGRNNQKTLLLDFLKEKDDNAKLSVLTGESGCGKTSFVEAEIIPELEKDNCSVIKLERYEDCSKLVQQKLNEIFHNSENIDLENSLIDCANKVISYNKTPVFIFDQFEQVFMGDPVLKEKLTEEICILLKQKKSLKVVIVVRSESFKNTMMLFSKKTVLCNCGLSKCKWCQIINLPLLKRKEAIEFLKWDLGDNFDEDTCKTVVGDLEKASKNEILPVSLRIVSGIMKRKDILCIEEYTKHGRARGLQTEYIDLALKSLHTNKIIASQAIFSLSDPSKGSVALTSNVMARIAQTSKDDMKTAVSKMLDIGLIKKTAKERYRIVHEHIADLLLEQGGKFISPIELQEFQMRRKVFFSGGINALEVIPRIQKSPSKKNRMFGYIVSGLGMMILLYRILVFDETQPYWIDITFTPAFIVGMGVTLLTHHYYVNFLSRMMKNEGIISKICSCIGSIVFLIAVASIYFKPQSWPFIVAVLFCFGSLKDWQLAYWSKLSPHLSSTFLYWGISMLIGGGVLFLFDIALNKMKDA
ncbi:ATP-binding protein, partial [Candidatus Babeliales bacterium]|nr:ATP-binding protein [Candidatus Babeliales bacterium]